MQRRLDLFALLVLAATATAQVFETTVSGDVSHPLGLHDETNYVAITDLDGDGRDDLISPTGVYLADGQGALVFSAGHGGVGKHRNRRPRRRRRPGHLRRQPGPAERRGRQLNRPAGCRARGPAGVPLSQRLLLSQSRHRRLRRRRRRPRHVGLGGDPVPERRHRPHDDGTPSVDRSRRVRGSLGRRRRRRSGRPRLPQRRRRRSPPPVGHGIPPSRHDDADRGDQGARPARARPRRFRRGLPCGRGRADGLARERRGDARTRVLAPARP